MEYEDALNELLDAVAGKGRWADLGKGLHTYPCYDENQDGLHAMCLVLERRGKIKRNIDTLHHVSWETIND